MLKDSSLYPLVSIIIVNYNGSRFIENCLRSVLKTHYPRFEVILVDNASTDNSLRLARDSFSNDTRLNILQLASNQGFPIANNVGLSKAQGEYLAFLNLDTEVKSDWLKELIQVASSDPRIGACQSKLVVLGEVSLLDGAGDFPTLHGIPFVRGHHTPDSGYDLIEEIFSARAAAMIVKRQIFVEIEGFDASFFMGYEDVDFCWRMRLGGYKIVFVPSSVVYHKGGGSAQKHQYMIAFHKHKNCIAAAMKNFDSYHMIKDLPFLICFRLILSVVPIKEFKGYFGPSFAGLKATFWLIKHLPEIFKKRLFVQHNVRKVTDSIALKLMPDAHFEVSLFKWIFCNGSKNYDFWKFSNQQFMSYISEKGLCLKLFYVSRDAAIA